MLFELKDQISGESSGKLSFSGKKGVENNLNYLERELGETCLQLGKTVKILTLEDEKIQWCLLLNRGDFTQIAH